MILLIFLCKANYLLKKAMEDQEEGFKDHLYLQDLVGQLPKKVDATGPAKNKRVQKELSKLQFDN